MRDDQSNQLNAATAAIVDMMAGDGNAWTERGRRLGRYVLILQAAYFEKLAETDDLTILRDAANDDRNCAMIRDYFLGAGLPDIAVHNFSREALAFIRGEAGASRESLLEVARVMRNLAENIEADKADQGRVVTPPPLRSHWHHGNGVIACGTVRIARADFDTNPSRAVQDEIFDWMCEVLNKAVKEAPAEPDPYL